MIRDSNSDDLKILLEPEAAALALAHHDGNNNGGFFSVGRKFLLVDCGGGTVDITSHESVSVNPLQLRSLAKSEGAKVGSEMVTKNFSAWLKGVISAVDEQAMKDMKRRGGAYFQVLEEFDKLKTSMTDAYNIPFINLRNLIEDYEDVVGRAFEEYNRNAIESMKVNYVKRTANLKLTKSLVKSFFEPLLVEIVESIGRVLDDATTRRNKVDFIAVVGGFAANKLLENRIRTSFVSPELGVLFPDLNMHPQAAVVIGAARGGALLGRKPGRDGDGGGDRGIINRIATKTIGVFFEPNKFQVLVKIGDDIPVNSVKELVGYPVNLTQTQCQWRLYQSDKENPTTTDGETLLGNVTVEVPQVGTIQEREMRAKIIFGEAEILVKIKLPQQNREFNGNLQFEKL
jgi:molecular chaperone DnaK (HSP70)